MHIVTSAAHNFVFLVLRACANEVLPNLHSGRSFNKESFSETNFPFVCKQRAHTVGNVTVFISFT